MSHVNLPVVLHHEHCQYFITLNFTHFVIWREIIKHTFTLFIIVIEYIHTYIHTYIQYASKRMQQFLKFVQHFLIRNRDTLLWFVWEAPDTELRCFLPNMPRFLPKRHNLVNVPYFHSKRCRNSEKGGIRRHGHQSAALLVGEKRCIYRHVFKCNCSALVAFFLTRTVVQDSHCKTIVQTGLKWIETTLTPDL